MSNSFITRVMRFQSVLSAVTICLVAGCSGENNQSGMTHTLHDPDPTVTAHIYVTSGSSNTTGLVSQHDIHSGHSVATAAIPTVIAGNTPTAIMADPARRYAYVANIGDRTISQYSIQSDGSLVSMIPMAVVNPGMTTANGLNELAVDPSGHYLYVSNSSDDTISQFAIGNNGTLSPMTPAFINVVRPASITIDPSGHHAYVASEATLPQIAGGVSAPPVSNVTEVFQYGIDSAGQLVALNPASIMVSGISAKVVIDHAGQQAYVLSNFVANTAASAITQYAIGINGALTATGASTPFADHDVLLDMKISQSGSPAYVLSNFMGIDTNSGALWQFTRDNSGILTSIPDNPNPFDMPAMSLTMSTLDNSLFVLNRSTTLVTPNFVGGSIKEYTVGSNGSLTIGNTISIGGITPNSMIVVPVH